MNTKLFQIGIASIKRAEVSPSKRAFTLLDLLAVVGVIALLACFVAPGLARTKPAGQSIQCLSNTRRLANVWHMYAQDNNDRLVIVFHGGNAQGGNFDPSLGPAWAEGWLDWTTSTDNTNENFLLNEKYARFAPYLSTAPSVFKCPSDIFLTPAQRARGWTQRVRSYSIDITLGAGNAESGPWDAAYSHVKKLSQMRFPSPAETYAFLDEHPDSMNDPAFQNPHETSWVDYPGRYHNGATALSFADGHAEMHQWQSAFASRSGAQVNYSNWVINENVNPGDPDIHWISYRAQRQTSSSF